MAHDPKRSTWRSYLPGVGAVILIAVGLYSLPGRTEIAPMVSADYAYIFLAADRLSAGEGLTSLAPVAPKQPWEYVSDWSFLTKWPMAYPVLLCGVRTVFQVGTVEAATIINILACALAVVGWFAWIRRSLPPGVLRWLLALVGAGSAFSIARFINPSTDMLLVAALPYLMLAVLRVADDQSGPIHEDQDDSASRLRSARRFASWFLIGLAASALMWLRYAAIFVPMGLALYLIVEVAVTRRCRLKDLMSFSAGAALPVLVLFFILRLNTTGEGVQAGVNLGTGVGFDFSPTMPATAWWLWTDLPFYDYKWYSHWFFALGVPCLPLVLVLVSRGYRRQIGTFITKTPYLLSAAMVVSLFTILVLCTTLFKSKYDFLNLERYYLPIRPLYFLLFVGPILLLRPIAVRVTIGLALLTACSWNVRQEWPRAFHRWQASRTEFTEYGRLAMTFKPHSVELYDWINTTTDRQTILFSNFHEDIALETGEPALPLPRTARQLDQWVERIVALRKLDQPKIRFVVDPDNHYRDYYLAPFDEVVARFNLRSDPKAPEPLRAYVFRPAGQVDASLSEQASDLSALASP